MTVLILGLLLFLGIHSVRIVAEPARQRFIAQRGEGPWKGLYSLVSAVGLGLIIWGYGLARQQPVVLWQPLPGMAHLAALLTLVAFVLIAAGNVPRNAIKARLRHPMMLGTKVWAFAHLLANNTLADVRLFGGFLVWSILGYRAARRRDGPQPAPLDAGTPERTGMIAGAGVLAWLAFAFWLHGPLIGVRPLG
ncbi:MAG: NnrU family protein [Aquabacterium sp.]